MRVNKDLLGIRSAVATKQARPLALFNLVGTLYPQNDIPKAGRLSLCLESIYSYPLDT